MSEDDIRGTRWQRLLVNRFVLVPLGLTLIAIGWNVFVATHDDGIVAGRVVDAAGRPIAGATVTLWAFNFTTFAEKSRTTTDGEGAFRFSDNVSHSIQLSAEKPGAGRSERVPVRLYFRGENTQLRAPLRLAGGA